LDKAALLTAGLALGSLTAGALAGAVLSFLTGYGFATAFIAFMEAASRATEVAPKTSIVPNIPEQVEEASKAVEQAVTESQQLRQKPSPLYLTIAITLSNLRTIALIPAAHSVLPFGMVLEGRGRLRTLGRMHETAITASGLAPLVINCFAMGGSLTEYPAAAPVIIFEALSLSLASYVASKALLSPGRGLERLRQAYTGSLGVLTTSMLVLMMVACLEAHNVLSAGGG